MVDDLISSIEGWDEILKPYGLEIVYSGNAEEAKFLIVERDFDAILVDLEMPDIDGITLAGQITLIKKNSAIIFHSAFWTNGRTN